MNILDISKNQDSAQSTLNFLKVTESEVKKGILNYLLRRQPENVILKSKILKKSVDIYVKEITFITNDCIEKGIFSDHLNLAYVLPILKKDGFNKEIY